MRAGYKGGMDLLRRSVRSPALPAPSLNVGIGVFGAVFEKRVRVNDQLSVNILHDTELSDHRAPSMTTVSMPSEEMGRRVVEFAIEPIDGGSAQHVLITTPP